MSNFIVYGYQDKEKPTMWYIGKTSRPLEVRSKEHLRHKKNGIFNNFYRKHTDRFVPYVLKNCSSEIEANAWEKIMIAQFDSFWPNGYNLTIGGEGQHGRKLSKESRDKISKTRKLRGVAVGSKNPNYGNNKLYGENNPFYGKKHSEETKEKLRKFRLGKPSPMRGKKWSDEAREKFRISNIGKHCGEKNPLAVLKEQQVIDIRNKFKGGVRQAELSRMFGVGLTTISHIVHNESWRHLLER